MNSNNKPSVHQGKEKYLKQIDTRPYIAWVTVNHSMQWSHTKKIAFDTTYL